MERVDAYRLRQGERLMKPVVFSAPSVETIQSRLHAMDRDGIRPTLAIAFSALNSDLDDVRSVFAKHRIALFGASSGSGFTQSGVLEGSIAAMLLDLPEESFQVRLFDGLSKPAAQAGRMVADWVKHVFNDPALLIIPIVRLSTHSAQLRLSQPVAPMTNLQLELAGVDSILASKPFYAKVLKSGDENGSLHLIRFTSVAPEVDAFFQAHLQYVVD